MNKCMCILVQFVIQHTHKAYQFQTKQDDIQDNKI